MTAVVLASPGPLFIDPNRQVVQSNGTITATGSATFSGFGTRELALVVNLTVAPTGSSPTITFSMQEIDPGNGATTLGSSVTGATLNSATTQILTLPLTLTGAVQVTWTVTGGSASFTGVYATLLSRSTTILSALDASNVEHSVLVDSSGRTLIVGAGTAGSSVGGVVSIQGVSGGTAIPISGSVTASNASIGITGSAIPTSATLIGASDGTNLIALKIKDASTAAVAADPSLVVALSPNSPVPAGSNVIGAVTQSGGPWSVSGTITVQQSTPSNLQGEVGGLAAAGSAPVGNPVQIGGWDGTDIRTLSTDATGHAIIVGDGTAGTPAGGVVSIQGVAGGTAVPISGSITASGTVTANQGTANTVANSWPTEITDGTHGPAAVKAASTAAAATDPSLVVALSPNSPLPAGSAVIGAVTQSGTWTVTATSATASNFLAEVGGLGAAGSALVGNPVQIGGSDGTNTRAILTDTSGRQNVVGAAASGSAVAGNPVLIGGSDGTDARTISTDASGHVIVVGDGTAGTPAGGVVSIQGVAGGTAVPISGSITASGTVTANQGTANTLANAWPTELTDGTHGPVAVKAASTAAAAADASLVVALSPNSPLPAGSAVIGAVTQSGTWTVTATSATASNFLAEVGGLGAAGSVLVGNPVQIGGSDGTNTRALLTDTSGRQNVVGAAASGSAVAGNPVLVGGSDGTDARTLSTDASGHAIVVGDGTAGTPAGGVVSIQGVSGGTAVPISGSVTASGTVTANQGTANTIGNAWPTEITDGTHGPAAVKAASTAAAAADPSLVVALSPNSPIPSGANVIGAVTQSGTWTVTATSATASNFLAEVGGLAAAGSAPVGNPVQIGGSDGTDIRTISTDSSGHAIVVGDGTAGTPAGGVVSVQGVSGGTALTVTGSVATTPETDTLPATQNITAQDTGSTSNTMANGQVFITGSPTASSTASFAISSLESVKLQVTGTWTGTLTVEVSLDAGTTWTACDLHQTGTSYTANSFTNNFFGGLNVSGTTNFRVRATAAWTGTATVKIVETVNVNTIYVGSSVKLADATTQSTLNTIKAASTAAVATDTSLVVALSPNSPLPAGSAVIGAVTQSGTWTVTATSATASNFLAEVGGLGAAGSALVGNPVQIGGSDGTNTRAISTDTSGHAIIVGNGTAGTPAGGVVSIQGVSGGTSVPISGSVTASGTVTSNQGTANTLANAWPMEITDATHGPVAVKAASTAAAAADASLVVALSPNSPIPSGSNVIGAVTQSGTWTTTVTQATAANLNAAVVGVGTAGTPSGGVVSIQGVSGGTAVPISGSVTASGTVTANQGTANTVANSWPTEITDGTHGPAAVKAASTAAAAADPSLVVALSPNSPLPAGSAVIGAVTQSGTWTVTATSATASNFLAEVGGLAAAGAAPVGNPVQIGGSDGTDIRTILTDSSGRPNVVGAAANGAAVAGNPVLIAGSDGTDARTLATSNTGNLITQNKPATTSSITSVASSATTVSLLASNANRLAALITNDGTGIMFVALAATASTTAYTYRVTSDSQILVDGFWTGAISAIWTSPNGSARITELTP